MSPVRVRAAAAALVALAVVVLPLQLQASAAHAQPLTLTPYVGIIRSAPGGWHILDDAAHTPQNLTSVTCDAVSGRLVLAFTPVTEVGTFLVGSDETWAGKYHAGASVGLAQAIITIRDDDGIAVPCTSGVLGSPSGNWWIYGEMWL